MPSSATRSPTTSPRAAPSAGLAVFTGSEDRQHAYVALTRGTDHNHAYVFTAPAKLADPFPARPAPNSPDTTTSQPKPATPPGDPDAPGRPAVLAEIVLDRDGQQQSATQTWCQALADADHLAVLHAIWTAETMPVREQRYRALLGRPSARLPPAAQPPASGCTGRCTPPNSPAWTPARS